MCETAHPTTYSDEKWTTCPLCGNSIYRYYGEAEGTNTDDFPIYPYYEIPATTKTPFGWLCILCRYEWYDSGEPVNVEDVKNYVQRIKAQSLQGKAIE